MSSRGLVKPSPSLDVTLYRGGGIKVNVDP